MLWVKLKLAFLYRELIGLITISEQSNVIKASYKSLRMHLQLSISWAHTSHVHNPVHFYLGM